MCGLRRRLAIEATSRPAPRAVLPRHGRRGHVEALAEDRNTAPLSASALLWHQCPARREKTRQAPAILPDVRPGGARNAKAYVVAVIPTPSTRQGRLEVRQERVD